MPPSPLRKPGRLARPLLPEGEGEITESRSKAGAVARLPALDGLRGLLALVVMGHHLVRPLGFTFLLLPSDFAVCGFFVLSGFVLTRAWDGRFGVFLARRFLRLWPVYALCLAVGYFIAAEPPVWTQFIWYPVLTANAKPAIDPPIWSLCIEAWAMLFMPFFVWAGRGHPAKALAGAVAIYVAGFFVVKFNFGLMFVAGAFLSRYDFRNRALESAVPQWIGKISYSLYLTHWLVFKVAQAQFGDIGLLASVPVAFLVGWLVWRCVELPSLQLSRRVDAWATTMAPDRPMVGYAATSCEPRA